MKRRLLMATRDKPIQQENLAQSQSNPLNYSPIVQILKDLYAHGNQHHNQIFQALKNKRLNPVLEEQICQRDDIEYYIPQLITYLAFQIDLKDPDFKDFILKGCELHYMFSHSCYFYLSSISKINGIAIPEIQNFISQEFIPRMTIYRDAKLTGAELAKCNDIKLQKSMPSGEERDACEKYGTMEQDEIKVKSVATVEIPNYTDNGYTSNLVFWEDLIRIGNDLSFCNPKKVGLMKELREINKRLPAAVYVPFVKDSLRYYTILNINVENARVFSTKQRSPYSIYLQLFRQEEQFIKVDPVVAVAPSSEDQVEEKELRKSRKKFLPNLVATLNKQLSKKLTIFKNKNCLNIKKKVSSQIASHDNKDEPYRNSEGDQAHILTRAQNYLSVVEEGSRARRSTTDGRFKEQGDQPSASSLSSSNDDSSKKNGAYEGDIVNRSSTLLNNSIKLEINHAQSVQRMIESTHESNYVDPFFDEPFTSVAHRIKQKSIYKDFKTWRLVNIMVKTGDNLKQEQFAMQLINQFNIIFNRENTGLLLRPYEVISIGPDSGILEMVTDTSSLGRIIKIMGREQIPTLKQFFKVYFKANYKIAQRNFCRSLAAYSLVTYFLQVKDRHNDNILLHREGYIVHIDFGFFLSNAPGGGIQLEKAVPFKLMSNYVELLGGPNSFLFMEFRSLFEKGFRAALKHQDEIITLVKMMYSSHGESMPCFMKGKTAIDELEARFMPEADDITEHCQNLINLSLDNWRARWYDKFQYWLQDIFY